MGKFCFHCASTKYWFYLHFPIRLYFLCQLYLVSQYGWICIRHLLYIATFKYRSASVNNCWNWITRSLITTKVCPLYTNDYICIYFTRYLTQNVRDYIFLQSWIYWDRFFSIHWKISRINTAFKNVNANAYKISWISCRVWKVLLSRSWCIKRSPNLGESQSEN